ncbi:transmembrane protein 53 [Hordeum vulgare]|nr:transmembrane protein 53 [Hordeum vulgare]
MSDIFSYNVKGKAEKNVELLSEHLADWVREEDGKKILFHTLSNTGWLCYGVILENLERQDPSAVEKIKGSVIDSAHVVVPDSEVWALGFSAAIMKKNSVSTKGGVSNDTRSDVIVVESQNDIRPAATEAVLLSALEKFFDIVLNYPAINMYAADPHMQLPYLDNYTCYGCSAAIAMSQRTATAISGQVQLSFMDNCSRCMYDLVYYSCHDFKKLGVATY